MMMILVMMKSENSWMNKIGSEKGEITMTKYYLCKEIATLAEHQRIRAEKVLHKRVTQWDGGDILNVVFDGEIQSRIDWDPEELGAYDTVEDAKEAAHVQSLKCSVKAHGSGLELVAYYIDEREAFDDGTWEEFGQYDLPRDVVEEEVPDREKDVNAFAEYLYRHGYDACDICKLREAYDLSEVEEDAVYSMLQSLYNNDQRILDKYYGKLCAF